MKSLNILLVDDAPDDIYLFRRAVRIIDSNVSITEVSTATAASLYLKKEAPFENAPTPDLIVSDSVVDHESGEDLLHWVRVHPSLDRIPFMLLTGDANPAVVVRGRVLGATWVIQKPSQFNDLVSALHNPLATVSNRKS